MWKRVLWGALPFLLLFALPFAMRLRVEREALPAPAGADTLVIITANDRVVCNEFEYAFREYYRKAVGREVAIDWRDVGGSADIMYYIDDRYAGNFREYYQERFPGEWNAETQAAFSNPKLPADAGSGAKLARKRFLDSDVGIGIDIVWGGGTYDLDKNARKGYGVDAGVAARHPEYLAEDVIPKRFSGEAMYDVGGRYYGACLSSFGICYNPDRYRELGLPPPESWDDLGRAELFGAVAIGDPTQSGSIAKCYEMMIQQKMQECADPETGSRHGMTLIKRLAANSELVADSAPKVAIEVAAGNAAAGLCIDYYGFSEREWKKETSGGAVRLVYVLPRHGSSLTCDPIQLLRGAPNRAVAEKFIDFVLSPEGQKIWDFKVGAPGGPRVDSPRRPPIRRDFYRDPLRRYLIDPDYDPYAASAGFEYRADLTGRYFSMIRVFVRCAMLDPIDELRAAWKAIIAAGGPEAAPQAWAAFCALPFTYAEATEMAAKLSTDGSRWTPLDVAALRRGWTRFARDHYIEAAKLAGEGK